MNDITILSSTNVRWQDYRDLRLKALREEPQAFGSSYESEKNTPDTEWQKRLENYNEARQDWAVFASNGQRLTGMVAAYQAQEDKKNDIANMIAMFVENGARGKGIGKLLVKNLMGLLTNSSIKKVRLSVSTKQVAAVKLYEGLGFKIVGRNNIELGDGKLHEVFSMEEELKKKFST